MVARTFEAIYEDGVLKPIDNLDLPEHQRVRVTIDLAPDEPISAELEAWLGVYSGLAETDIAEVESVALDRRGFMRPAS